MLIERSSRRELEVQDRLIDELIGICRGVIADDNVDEREEYFSANGLKTTETLLIDGQLMCCMRVLQKCSKMVFSVRMSKMNC